MKDNVQRLFLSSNPQLNNVKPYFCFFMTLKFSKYQGAGNDFIIVNDDMKLTENEIRFMCDRHFGIGSDGLMFVGKSENGKLSVRFHNPDASMSFCGNGSRCAMAFAVHNLGCSGDEMIFEGFDGEHKANYRDGYAHIEMHITSEVEKVDDFYFVNTGAPHAVYQVGNLEELKLKEVAFNARNHSKFQPIGTNVNFYSENEDGSLAIRTFEKGVEDETLACGTGITACVLVHHSQNLDKAFEQVVHAKGGQTSVVKNATGIWLGGPALHVFEGRIELPQL